MPYHNNESVKEEVAKLFNTNKSIIKIQQNHCAVLIVLLIVWLLPNQAYAGKVEVYWDDPKGYTDIKAGAEHRAKFARRMQLAFNQHFAKLATKLPAHYVWKIRISDVDLAGYVTKIYFNKTLDKHRSMPTSRGELRVYDARLNPSITISYIVTDTNTGKIMAGDKLIKLTDRFVSRYPSPALMTRAFSYDKFVITSWFNKVLLPFLKPNKTDDG